MNDLTVDLERLGDALQQATRKDHLRHVPARTSRPAFIAIGVAAAVLVLGSIAVAATLWPTPTPTAESQGLLASDAVFAGAHPRCDQVADAQFHCLLSAAPTGLVILGPYTDTKVATVDAQSHVNGGCVATSADGRSWDCYIGQLAVERGIVDQSYLGTTRTQIAHG
jgi:hypothetical protein